ncbi:hypothetical protein SATMO3_18390 [Sporomusa aerivorans]
MCVVLKSKVNYTKIAELGEDRISYLVKLPGQSGQQPYQPPGTHNKSRPQSLNLQD